MKRYKYLSYIANELKIKQGDNMTKRKNMTAAQRQQKVEKDVEQLQMATRISQMLLQQLGNSSNTLGRDLSELASRQRDNQYQFLALRELLNINLDELNKKAEELQIKDFDEASEKEDAEKDYTVADVVEEDSVVIITTKVDDDNEKSILRSKLAVSELNFPQFKEDLMGKKAGDELEADINGVKHKVTLLGIRKKPAEPEQEEEAVQQGGETLKEVTKQDEQQAETNG